MKKPSVTIGIPAYNEEKNIKSLLQSVLTQKTTNYDLKKIIVISDASTDTTDQIVASFQDVRIQLVKNINRKGQNYCQNKIFALANTDIVILFEADSCPKNNEYVQKLLSPIKDDPRVHVVQGNPKPLPPHTLTERVLYFKDRAFWQSIQKEEYKEKVVSGVSGRAFTKSVYKQLLWPSGVPEDMYAFLWCKDRNINIDFQSEAHCWFRLPQTFNDYMKKRKKIATGTDALNKYFSPSVTKKYYSLHPFLMIKMVMILLVTHPLLLINYLVYVGLEKIRFSKVNIQFTDYWETAETTKNLFLET